MTSLRPIAAVVVVVVVVAVVSSIINSSSVAVVAVVAVGVVVVALFIGSHQTTPHNLLRVETHACTRSGWSQSCTNQSYNKIPGIYLIDCAEYIIPCV